MYVTYPDLIQVGILIVALANLIHDNRSLAKCGFYCISDLQGLKKIAAAIRTSNG